MIFGYSGFTFCVFVCVSFFMCLKGQLLYAYTFVGDWCIWV